MITLQVCILKRAALSSRQISEPTGKINQILKSISPVNSVKVLLIRH